MGDNREFYHTMIVYVCVTSLLYIAPTLGERIEVSYTITEEPSTGAYIGDIMQDANLQAHYTHAELDTLQFRTLPTNSQLGNTISVNPNTGVITVVSRLDRDEFCQNLDMCKVELNLVVTNQKKFVNVRVVIILLDLNDNSPVFSRSTIVLDIPESQQPGARFVLPSAVDPDSGDNGIRDYSLQSVFSVFALEVKPASDGLQELQLVLQEPLDRYTLICIFLLI